MGSGRIAAAGGLEGKLGLFLHDAMHAIMSDGTVRHGLMGYYLQTQRLARHLAVPYAAPNSSQR